MTCGKRVLNIKRVFNLCLKLLSETFSAQTFSELRSRYVRRQVGLNVKCPVLFTAGMCRQMLTYLSDLHAEEGSFSGSVDR